MGTLIGIILAAFTWAVSSLHAEPLPYAALPLTLGLFFFILVVCHIFILASAFLPLQRAELDLTPRVLELFRKNQTIKWIHRGIIALGLIMIFLLFSPMNWPFNPFIVAIIILGITFDLIQCLVNQIYKFLNPYKVSEMFTKTAEQSILQLRETDLCDSLESLSEMSLKSLDRSSASLCNQSLDEMREIMRLFLEGTKSIALSGTDDQAKASGITDKVSYTLFYFFNRIEVIYQKALNLHFSHVCSSLVTLLGKVALYAAKCDLSLAGYVINFIGKFCKTAEEKGESDIALKGSCALIEVSRKIINEVDLKYMDLKDPFFTLITQLDDIAKETFKKDKESNITFLTAPFHDLKKLFESPKVASHPDTPIILADIDRVLAEWNALDLVLRTLPPLGQKEVLPTEENQIDKDTK